MALLKSVRMIFLITCVMKHATTHPAYKNMKYSQPLLEDFTTTWPLKEIFFNMELVNLDEVVSMFQPCLTNIQNFHGINIAQVTSPIYLTRYDVFNIANKAASKKLPSFLSWLTSSSKNKIYKVPFEKVSFHLKNKTAPLPAQSMEIEDRSMKAKWNCFVQIDLFYPEIRDAFHFYLHQLEYGPIETNIFGFEVRASGGVLNVHGSSK